MLPQTSFRTWCFIGGHLLPAGNCLTFQLKHVVSILHLSTFLTRPVPLSYLRDLAGAHLASVPNRPIAQDLALMFRSPQTGPGRPRGTAPTPRGAFRPPASRAFAPSATWRLSGTCGETPSLPLGRHPSPVPSSGWSLPSELGQDVAGSVGSSLTEDHSSRPVSQDLSRRRRIRDQPFSLDVNIDVVTCRRPPGPSGPPGICTALHRWYSAPSNSSLQASGRIVYNTYQAPVCDDKHSFGDGSEAGDHVESAEVCVKLAIGRILELTSLGATGLPPRRGVCEDRIAPRSVSSVGAYNINKIHRAVDGLLHSGPED